MHTEPADTDRLIADCRAAPPAVADRLVVFAHGMESGPWGTKIKAMRDVAEARGWACISPDYSATRDPELRIRMLLARRIDAQQLVLVGSSMGGYVTAHACQPLQPQAALLLAPALYFDRYPRPPAWLPDIAATIHGLQDDVVPPSASQRVAEAHGCALHLVHDDHRLVDSVSLIKVVLADLLRRVEAPQPARGSSGPSGTQGA